MANPSIYAAFERMWQHTIAKLSDKADADSINQLFDEKANKSGLTLGVHTDGLVYIFIDGSPHGNGLDIKADVVEGDVFGYVDENNTIVLNGALAEGTYAVKYEMEDGSVIEIGDLVLDSNTYYSVTNNLTNCTNSNGDTQAVGGKSYSATISANSGYELSSVVVTMGGSSVSVSGGNINIANVTGNIVITAVAEKVQVQEPDNLFDPEANGFILNGRCSSSGADRVDSNGYFVSNYIDVQNGDTVYIKNAAVSNGSSAYTGMKLTSGNTIGLFPNNSDHITNYSETGGVTQFTINKTDADYIRICFVVSSGTALTVDAVKALGVIITINEPLS